MSLDYPEYQELRKQSWFLGLLWRIGDLGYYLGLFGALGSPLMMIYSQLTRKRSFALVYSLIGWISVYSILRLHLFGFRTA